MKKGDKIISIVIICLIIVSSISVFAYKQYVKGSHRIAVIKQDGKIIKKIDLDKSKEKSELKVPSEDGHFNIIETENGKIRISDTDCPDKVCSKTGWISEAGETIVCLPHKLMIEINGKNDKIDVISS